MVARRGLAWIAVGERLQPDGPIIINCLRGIFIRYQIDESMVEAFQIQFARVKFLTELVKIRFDDRPTHF